MKIPAPDYTAEFRMLCYSGGVAFEDADIAVRGLCRNDTHIHAGDGTLFIAVVAGMTRVETQGFPLILLAGMYAALPALSVVCCSHGLACAVTAKRYRGMFSAGGPAEKCGRLRYIDGCTDTGLIQPLRLGDPCLNYLHFPQNTTQTEHTHPSHRIGVVLEGEGFCRTPNRSVPMGEGDMFIIPKNSPHRFRTSYSAMHIIAFHPDSEFGPTDERHQMLEATKTQEAAMGGG